jgi:4a-hydroxytetrahydrobiopterin dehydratase
MSKEELSKKKCVPCEGGVPALTKKDAKNFLKDLKMWKLSKKGKSVRAEYVMRDFASAVELISCIAAIAEAEDHHPDLHLTGYRKLAVELSTHAIGGLSENDFILAAKIEALPKQLKESAVL